MDMSMDMDYYQTDELNSDCAKVRTTYTSTQHKFRAFAKLRKFVILRKLRRKFQSCRVIIKKSKVSRYHELTEIHGHHTLLLRR